MDTIPLAFLLGFFVSQVYSRWNQIFDSIPWPFSLIDWMCITLQLPRDEPDGREKQSRNQDVKIVVQTCSRYVHLSLAMVLRDICYQFRSLMKERKLTFVDMGLASDFEMRQLYSTQELMPHELEKLKWPKGKNEEKRTASWNWWLPCAWATRLIRDAYDRGFVDNKENMALVYQKIHDYKALLGGLIAYDSIPVPLPYTQVVSIGVYTYFFLALFAYQNVTSVSSDSGYDRYFVPSTLLLQFLIYYGWFKVAEVLLTPYGRDLDYNYDMVGYFALHLEQSRAHVEYSYDMETFLREDPHSITRLARVPREDLFVTHIESHMFGSLVDGIVDIPGFIMDTSVTLWKLPKSVWNNNLTSNRQKNQGSNKGQPGPSGSGSHAIKDNASDPQIVYIKNTHANSGALDGRGDDDHATVNIAQESI
ncbi:bestrophin homolog 22-like isoform X2 [Symsagittifera roscoffensis]